MLPFFRALKHAVGILSILGLILLSNCTTQPTTLQGMLPVVAPSALHSGDSLRVTVGPVADADGKSIGLVMIGAQGLNVYRSVFEADTAYFDIPQADTAQIGYLTLIAAVDDARGETVVMLLPQRTAAIANPQHGVGVASLSTPTVSPAP